MNGEDNLSYYDIALGTVVPFTTLSNPSVPTLTANNVGGTGFNVYYAITANSSVGETAASTSLTVPVDTDRDLWNPPSAGGTDNVIIAWSAVTNAESYNVYMGTAATGGGAPILYLIASGVNGATFTDDGTLVQDITRPSPSSNSTAGPKATRGSVINGRVFLTGDSDQPYFVRFGGDFGYELDFSPANGGGYVPVGSGTKELPIKVMPFRDAKGTAQITVLCQGTNGRGKRYLMTPDTVTYGNVTISFYDVTEDSGQDGTEAPDGVILYNNSLWYPSRDGFKTTGTKPQLQNVLSTDRVSNTIQPDLKTVNNNAMDKCVGIGFEGRLYWAMPVASEMNNEIWVLDLDRKGAWMKPWSISADWLTLYNDNSGTTHLLVLSANGVYELSYSALTSDNGSAVPTFGQSGEIYFSKDKRQWAKLLQVIFVLTRPQGTINFSITGKTEDSLLTALGEPTPYNATTTSSVTGWGEPGKLLGFGRYAWSKVGSAPMHLTDGSQEVIVEIDEEVQWVAYNFSSSTTGVDYGLSDIILEYIPIGIRDLS